MNETKTDIVCMAGNYYRRTRGLLPPPANAGPWYPREMRTTLEAISVVKSKMPVNANANPSK